MAGRRRLQSPVPIAKHLLDRCPRRNHLVDLSVHVRCHLGGGIANVLARWAAGVPGIEEATDLLQREPKAHRVAHKANALECRLGIQPVSTGRPRSFGDDAEPLVMADGVATDARLGCDLADSKGSLGHLPIINVGIVPTSKRKCPLTLASFEA